MEARHLRMHKVAADREAGLLQQFRGAALSRGGEAAATAREELAELIDQGEAIRRSILRRELGLDRLTVTTRPTSCSTAPGSTRPWPGSRPN